MVQKVFSKSNERLIRVFLEEEAKQYPFRYCENFEELYKIHGNKIPYEMYQLNKAGKDWVGQVFRKIINGIEKLPARGANKYIIQSLGNTGCVINELSLDGSGEYFNWKNGDCFITLCTCGRINHWGFVSMKNPGAIADLTATRN